MIRDTSSAKVTDFLDKFISALLPGVSIIITRDLWCMNQEWLELRWSRAVDQKNGRSAWDALHDTTPQH
jgi:hypothetical protein